MTKQVHFAVQLPAIHNVTVWSDPLSGSHIAFDSFAQLAHTAERGKFDFFFLAEGLRLREHKGRIYEFDTIGRPDNLTMLTAIASVTTHLGLVGTVNTTFNEPYEIARRLATLDHLSEGRSGWNVVTSHDSFTGENFRRGGFFRDEDRYDRAAEFLAAVKILWKSWSADDLIIDPARGVFARAQAGKFAISSHHFELNGRFSTPRSPQGGSVIVQAGESEAGREFAAAQAEVIFSKYNKLPEAQEFYRNVKDRLGSYGRSRDDLLIFPTASVIVAETDHAAKNLAREITYLQVSPQTAITHMEAVWGTDLSNYDPDGPLPSHDPVPENMLLQGHSIFKGDRLTLAQKWRSRAEEHNLSIRELVIDMHEGQTFVGSPVTVAQQINNFIQTDGADGFILVPSTSPYGLDEFVDTVIPILQDMEVYRTEYSGITLRENLGLARRDHS